MPCFTLSRDGKPVKLQDIDKELCDMLGVPCDDNEWVLGWYDSIGLGLACGCDWDKIRKILIIDDSEHHKSLAKVIDYLRNNFTTDSWYCHK